MKHNFLSLCSFARAVFTAFVFLLSSTASATSPVGATPGSFTVSPTGAATYTIPIAVPPGTAGMEPKLALSYNSQGGNGLVGMGWSLSGLSAITRCPQTVAQDGVKGSVNFDANDRFCLDGQRLAAIAGAYGADGTEYRTEIESFNRIISYGTAGSGPAWFKVWTKSGQIIEFANTADSRIEAQGKASVLVWAVNKISDTVGNYLSVTYAEDNANGQYVPTRIDYTGYTDPNNVKPSGLPYNSVQISYIQRPDIVPSYIAGSQIRSTMRMTNIKTYAGVALIRDYRLAYGLNAANNTSQLASVTECTGDGVSCLSPTTFAWQAETTGAISQPSTWWPSYGAWCDPLHLKYGDFNGDGRTDMICNTDDGKHIIAFSSGDGTFTSPSWWPVVWCDPAHLDFGDFNGDGKTDMICNSDAGWHNIAFSNGDGTFTAPTSWPSTGAWCDPLHLKYGDFNGDGKTDMICNSNSGWHVIALSNGDGTFTAINAWPSFTSAWCDPAHLDFGDFNGDGKTDMICNSDAGWHNIAFSNGDGYSFTAPTSWPSTGAWCDPAHLKFGDFNGDGKTDMICNSDAGWHNIAFSNGDGTFTAPTSWPSTGAWCDPLHLKYGDFNGDGKLDMMCNGDPGWHSIAFSKGDGTFSTPPGTAAWCNPAHLQYGDFNGDGKTDLLCNDPVSGQHLIALEDAAANVVASITNGLGVTASLTYKPLTDNTIYTKGGGAVYPVMDLQAPIYVVSHASSSNGVGGTFNTTYTYGGAKADLQGRGFLGFQWVRAVDNGTNIDSYTEYAQSFPYTGMATLSIQRLNGAVLKQSSNTLATLPVQYTGVKSPYVSTSAETGNDLNGAILPSVTSSSTYDAYGNPTQIAVTTTSGGATYTKTTANTYTNDTTNWLLGRLTRATVTSTKPDNTSLTRASAFSYNATNGLLTQEVIEPDNAALRLQTDYGYDSFGNKTSVTVSGAGIVTRTNSTTYDSRGQFPVTSANALGHTETRAYDARFGTVSSLTGPNGLTTAWQYDGFGRKVLETRADSTQTTWDYNAGGLNCWGAAYAVYTTTSGAPGSGTCYDILNREIRSFAQGFDSTIVYKDTQYDSLGRVSQTSRPYYAGGTTYWTSYAYDSIGRVYQVTEPDGSQTTTGYNGLATTITDANGNNTTRVKNSQGQLVQVTDAKGGITQYSYDPFGNLTQTIDAKNNITTLAYDIRGRKISMTDPDMGHWSYQYNVLGELTQQTDAKLQVTTLTYDKLGRMLTRNEPDLTSTWTYDTAVKGIGKPASVSAGNGYARSYTYDTLGRIVNVVSTIDTTYTVSTSYDAYGRVATYTHPTGFAVKNVYNPQGYLAEVRNNASNALYWQATAKDAEGHVLNETLGNGLTTTRQYWDDSGRIYGIMVGTNSYVQNDWYGYDGVGNLAWRFEGAQTYDWQNFTYDELNRLLSKTGATAQSYQYDSIGNITYKSDLGFYAYNTNGIRPHAVANVTGPTATLNYTYDANGNLLTGAGRTVTWNSFNMVSQVSQGASGPGSTGTTLTYAYDPDHTRIKETGPTGTTIYLNPRLDQGGHFEKITKPDGSIEYKHYLYAGGQSIGVYTSRSTGKNDTRYFHTDHLGSVAVVTDETGAVVARFSYDPFGNRTTVSGDATVTHHGFTGHETMVEVGLVNMNGRIYDPALARFMSADPNIQAPGNGQSFNRYSYVFNNPLSATDPSGYLSLFGHKILPGLFNNKNARVAVAIAAIAFAPEIMAESGWYLGGTIGSGAVAQGIVAGGIIGYVSTGTAQGTLNGAMSGAMFGAIGDFAGTLGPNFADGTIGHAALDGFGGGVMSSLQGGSFGSGFLSAGMSEWIGPNMGQWGEAEIVKRAVIGGTFSVVGGGKFGNGAMTAAYAYLFNYCAHNGCFDRRFDWNDAVDQWRNGNGSTVTDVKASELNLTDATYTKNANGSYQIHTSIKFDTGAIYGTVTGVLNVDGTMSIKPDRYDFDQKNPFKATTGGEFGRLIVRDALTFGGAVVNGPGTPYRIEFSGTIPAPNNLPR